MISQRVIDDWLEYTRTESDELMSLAITITLEGVKLRVQCLHGKDYLAHDEMISATELRRIDSSYQVRDYGRAYINRSIEQIKREMDWFDRKPSAMR